MGLAKALPVIYLICIVLAAILVYTYLWRTTKSINQNVLYYPAFKTGINEIPYKVYKSSIILIYTNFWGQATWSYFENYKRNCKCNLEYCEISYSKGNLKSADVVLFHGHPTDLLSYQKLLELNDYRKQHNKQQLWAFFSRESPTFSRPPERGTSNLFNITITYRSTSDIPFSWGHYVGREDSSLQEEKIDSIIKNKTRQILWMVSNCGNKRDDLAHYFENNGLKLDVLGGCSHNFKSKLNCKKTQCAALFSKYKFYFAAENSFCEDYITEKYWMTPFRIGAVPIVLGGGNYSDPRLAIPGSFINVFDFKSPKELVNYIKKVDSDIYLYKTYFAWRKQWRPVNTKTDGCVILCNLCQRLREGFTPTNNVFEAVNPENECKEHGIFFDEWIKR